MGHHSENLVGDPELAAFKGLILSPVNRTKSELIGDVRKYRTFRELDIVFDPQLYCPQSQRGNLPHQSYFPSDLETADYSSETWWETLTQKIGQFAHDLKVNKVCTPAILPRKRANEYYSRCLLNYVFLAKALRGTEITPVMSVCVSFEELENPAEVFRMASIITTLNSPTQCYLVIETNIEPRRELNDSKSLLGLMSLISLLERANCQVTLSHCGSELLLAKAAGATHCASGKFFNLRRFSRTRFEEADEGGGGQLPYWFEHSLVAFLRGADIFRLQSEGLGDYIDSTTTKNPISREILLTFTNHSKKAWVALGWRQYLYWFADTERDLANSEDPIEKVSQWLKEAEARWQTLEDKDILLEESRNDGRWIRPWRQALSDFKKLN